MVIVLKSAIAIIFVRRGFMKLKLLAECDCREQVIGIPLEKDSEGEHSLSDSIEDSQGYFHTILTNPHSIEIVCVCGKRATISY